MKSEVAKRVPEFKASYENDWKQVDKVSVKTLEANIDAMKKWDSDPVGAMIKERISKDRSGKYKKGSMISTDTSDWYLSKAIESAARKVATLSFLPKFEAELKKRKNQ